MNNIKQHPLSQIYAELCQIFGEDCPVDAVSFDRQTERQGDCIMGYFRVEDITLTINIQRLLKDG